MDAEALVEDLNKMPSGKGSWLRCLEVDHSRSNEEQFKDWDACIWQHNGIGVKKMVRSDGGVMDCIDPHPYRWHYMDGKLIRPWKYEAVRDAWIDGDELHLRMDSGEYLSRIVPDSEILRYDKHPYRPDYDLEHFAIECYRHRIPRNMMAWRKEYLYGTPGLRPFSRNISVEDAKKVSLMGVIPDGLVPNGQFNQICECAEWIGIVLKLSYDVPVLRNLAMYPVEENCKTCLRRRSPNRGRDSECWKKRDQICCGGYVWDRKSPGKSKDHIKANNTDEEE